MGFSGKATYSAGANLPELAEDVSDVISIVSPYETPLLEALGDSIQAATSTHHEWMEDSLLPNRDAIGNMQMTDPETQTQLAVAHGDRFRAGDQIQADGSHELMQVTAVADNMLTVVRGYGSTGREAIEVGQGLTIIGGAALEGEDSPAPRFGLRQRCSNRTQIFTATVEVSGSDLASSQIGLSDEMDYQKQERLRELLRDLENTVINGGSPAASPQGSGNVRRTMKGIVAHLQTHVYAAGSAGMPAGTELSEEKINYVLRKIWEGSNGMVDTIVVGGFQKRKINGFLSAFRHYESNETTLRDGISAYQSDFGLCRIIVTRWMPQDMVLLLDSSRVKVLPLKGRSFYFKPLATNGDYERGELIGEYTLELRNESAHGLIRGLATV